ncbi:putative superfamily III holin-X [Curtobacterium sp. PhB130]|uniref:phage holin family protein n=1 Tax=unclassified Curtobacterium TaxID=257496 RepID=UPI000F4C664E|nr:MULTISPECIES: phage holin family protein [unclassified Curtobacterium]ROP63897.1 putative superfamily III holin-X [Curtobacterium sp. ZW137]ROS78107.1 putative superfamily III holin-X [Curtobacterium sp. PhB130]
MSHTVPGATPTGQPSPEERAASTPLGELLTDVSRDISSLFRQEVALAKAEITESAKKAGKGAGMFGGAGLTALFALLFLSIAAWWGLGYLIGNAWSAVVIAVVYAIVAGILALLGRKQMQQIKGVPQTVETAKEIPDALKPNTGRNA